ncbi:MAG: hypothetical protein ACYS9Y_08955, partial [Planctomycetota bacterium]
MGKTSTLLSTVLIPVVLAVVLFLYAPCSGSADSQPAEKVILGFEKAELSVGEAIAYDENSSRSWFFLLDGTEGFEFAARFEWPGGKNRAWTWLCRPGEHTEGDLALVTTARPANPTRSEASFAQTEFLSQYYPSARNRFEADLLMTTFQWLSKSRPQLRDWSGYERLRMDVRCEEGPVEIWLAVEDDVMEPPVVRTFNAPKGEWVTLEVDLKKAVEVRELDLSKIANFWLMGRAPVRTTVRIDNVRITKRDVDGDYKVLRDESSMAVIYGRPKRPEVPDRSAGVKADRSAVKLTEALVVAEGSVAPLGWVSAYDNNLIFVAYSVEKGTKPKAAYTDDGGLTWKQLRDPTARNLDHGTARGCAIDVEGDGISI